MLIVGDERSLSQSCSVRWSAVGDGGNRPEQYAYVSIDVRLPLNGTCIGKEHLGISEDPKRNVKN